VHSFPTRRSSDLKAAPGFTGAVRSLCTLCCLPFLFVDLENDNNDEQAERHRVSGKIALDEQEGCNEGGHPLNDVQPGEHIPLYECRKSLHPDSCGEDRPDHLECCGIGDNQYGQVDSEHDLFFHPRHYKSHGAPGAYSVILQLSSNLCFSGTFLHVHICFPPHSLRSYKQ